MADGVAACTGVYDLVILDVVMPGMGGIEARGSDPYSGTQRGSCCRAAAPLHPEPGDRARGQQALQPGPDCSARSDPSSMESEEAESRMSVSRPRAARADLPRASSRAIDGGCRSSLAGPRPAWLLERVVPPRSRRPVLRAPISRAYFQRRRPAWHSVIRAPFSGSPSSTSGLQARRSGFRTRSRRTGQARSCRSTSVAQGEDPGGWLVMFEGHLTFVPDAEHRWTGGSLE